MSALCIYKYLENQSSEVLVVIHFYYEKKIKLDQFHHIAYLLNS